MIREFGAVRGSSLDQIKLKVGFRNLWGTYFLYWAIQVGRSRQVSRSFCQTFFRLANAIVPETINWFGLGCDEYTSYVLSRILLESFFLISFLIQDHKR